MVKLTPTSLTGQRNLLAQDESKLKAAVKEVLQAIHDEQKAGIQFFLVFMAYIHKIIELSAAEALLKHIWRVSFNKK